MGSIIGLDGKPVGGAETNKVVDAQGQQTVDLELLAKVEDLKTREDIQATLFAMTTCYQAYAVFRRQLNALPGDPEAKKVLLDQVMRGQINHEIPLNELGRDLQGSIGPMFISMHNRSVDEHRKRKRAYDNADRVIRARPIPIGFLDGSQATLQRGDTLCLPVELAEGQNLQQVALLLSERLLLDNVRAYSMLEVGGEALKDAPALARKATILPDFWKGALSDKDVKLWDLQYADVLICPAPNNLWLDQDQDKHNWRDDYAESMRRLKKKGISLILLGPQAVRFFDDILSEDEHAGCKALKPHVLLRKRPLKMQMNTRKGAEDKDVTALELVNEAGVLVHDIPLRKVPADEMVTFKP